MPRWPAPGLPAAASYLACWFGHQARGAVSGLLARAAGRRRHHGRVPRPVGRGDGGGARPPPGRLPHGGPHRRGRPRGGRHARWGSDFTLYYAHPPGRAAHLDELAALGGGRLRACTGRGQLWEDLGPALARQPLGTQLYVCGPLAMIDAVTEAARALYWPEARIRSEAFGAAAEGPREPFRARLAASGRQVRVRADETLLEALERAGLDVPSMCRQGVCGECRTPVAGGAIDHRDLVLSAAEKASGQWIMPCVSRAASEPGQTAELEFAGDILRPATEGRQLPVPAGQGRLPVQRQPGASPRPPGHRGRRAGARRS